MYSCPYVGQEGVWGSGSATPVIPNIGFVLFTSRLFYSQKTGPRYGRNRWLGGLQYRCGLFGSENNQFPVTRDETTYSQLSSSVVQFSLHVYVVGSKTFRPDLQKPRQMENAVRDI